MNKAVISDDIKKEILKDPDIVKYRILEGVNKLETGMVIMMKYTASIDKPKEVRTVLVLHPNYKGKLHAIKIDNLSESDRQRLNTMFNIDFLEKLNNYSRDNMKFTKDKINMNDHKLFYEKVIKPFISTIQGVKENEKDKKIKTCYRTYFLNYIADTELCQVQLKSITPNKKENNNDFVINNDKEFEAAVKKATYNKNDPENMKIWKAIDAYREKAGQKTYENQPRRNKNVNKLDTNKGEK